ncbi:MAG: TIGR04282 family arsenosugar biosynthesis glycosyltransferase [Desulfarculus sp.]|nr:TIGR04282 family arsenosugar biosynthesis glycosyltransferase [Pseudomonadota bacterium]MBV1716853.1 TIGR04282 family arsenosugar biosynthesis glycosyltransferase [Desulfarculus sp.]MBU4574558.1 TIGR04282 family arsenosugar biosynthesis glycosyltransferase [Pseudomonadota bacterium]MBU4598909.1 TIGR04282 family arsenosugar biosynthesis glycosyltransferase [Pseudomonadota bacterium]MBV1738356.1 TIGR04282 family arsenosugar biosynthesis glycosyltransferase [Desulfarculus sp.]
MPDYLPRLILFSRLPLAGRAKTRLAPALGAGGAAQLQDRVARRLAGRMEGLAERLPLELELCYTGGKREQAQAWLGAGFACREQGGGHLGARMARALERALKQGAPKAVLVGSDLPGLDQAILEQALAALERSPLALGPSLDGGYYLVGQSRPAPGLLEAPHWQSLAALSARAKALGLEPALLPPLRDLDTPGDLAYWRENDPQVRSWTDPAS